MEGDRSSVLTYINKSDGKILAPLRMAYCEHVTRTINQFFFEWRKGGSNQDEKICKITQEMFCPKHKEQK